ncbi:hypothetical protein HYN49_07700 [Flavobacterium pallidum]|uniref:Uncharacterized protein n=1 Tax=Flavobacterium pallidum TaxID=2172098 RepID=A0A2S1SHA4_9FLAO|nr:hypothetical protein HYN49_07700 [Flavobacterium pallidum]
MFSVAGVAQDTITKPVTDSITSNNPLPEEEPETPKVSTQGARFPMSDNAFNLSLCILGFGVLLIIGEIILVYRLSISPQDTIKFIVVTVIVIGSLYLITAGYTNDQIAPAMGLLGTIAGYLLGKMGPESNANKSNS